MDIKLKVSLFFLKKITNQFNVKLLLIQISDEKIFSKNSVLIVQGRTRGSECKSGQICRICKTKHHTSICDKDKGFSLTTNRNKAFVAYPVVLIKVDGITFNSPS